MHLLSYLLWTPVIGALLVVLVPPTRRRLARGLALGHAGLTLALAILALTRFSTGTAAIQLAERLVWNEALGVSYALGVDGLSMPMVLLTAALGLFALLSHDEGGSRGYHAWMLLLEAAILGVFLSRDWTLFYMFWEGSLIPLFFLINQWGGPRRHEAGLNFVLYTMFGSAFLITAFAVLFLLTPGRSFDMAVMATGGRGLPAATQALLFVAFLIGFGVKFPMFPLHGWMPLTHSEAPPPVIVLLSAIKMGAYGLIRVVGTLPEGALRAQSVMLALALVGMVYGGLLAWRQRDLRLMVAYSIISHSALILLGISACNEMGLFGAALQMVAHGLIAGSLFLLVGALTRRTGSRDVSDLGGLPRVTPWLSILAALAFLASLGLPGGVGFVAEFHTLLGALQRWRWGVAGAALGVVISAGYALRTIGRLLFGPTPDRLRGLSDLHPMELVAALPLAIATVALGLLPAPLIAMMAASARALAAPFGGGR